MNVPGLIGIIVFYGLILAIGLAAACRRRNKGNSAEEVMLAGRSIGPIVGILTMTATWVGGGYINGSAEKVYDVGLIWCQAPFGYALSLAMGGFFFAHKMRSAGYVTMLDPLQDKLGQRMGGLLFFPALMGEMFWSAAILSALGSTLAVILNMGNTLSILVSAGIAVAYTLVGGLYSVAYTDVVQLFCIFIGLWLSVPFALNNEAVGSLSLNETDWMGHIPSDSPAWGLWVDYWLLLICGGLPWQVYFQRVLSARTPRSAQLLSYSASIGCLLSAVPACLIGAIAKATDWSQTEFGHTPEGYEKKLVLPLVMQYLTPTWVSFVGLGAVSAAVMSSADSSVLSAASMFARNIYKMVFRQKASELEVIWVMRGAIIAMAGMSCGIGIAVDSIYYLLYVALRSYASTEFDSWRARGFGMQELLLTEAPVGRGSETLGTVKSRMRRDILSLAGVLCGDLVYVILFPQLTMVVHFGDHINTYGSFVGFCVGFAVRLLGGEPYINIPAVIHYPFFDYEKGEQNFPFRTMSMLCSLVCIIVFSALFKSLFKKGIIKARFDVCECFYPKNQLAIVDKKRTQSSDCESDAKLLPPVELKKGFHDENCAAAATVLLNQSFITEKSEFLKV